MQQAGRLLVLAQHRAASQRLPRAWRGARSRNRLATPRNPSLPAPRSTRTQPPASRLASHAPPFHSRGHPSRCTTAQVALGASKVTFAVVLSGAVADFDQVAYKRNVAALLKGVRLSEISLDVSLSTVAAGSVRVVAAITTTNQAVASAAVSVLERYASGAAEQSAMASGSKGRLEIVSCLRPETAATAKTAAFRTDGRLISLSLSLSLSLGTCAERARWRPKR